MLSTVIARKPSSRKSAKSLTFNVKLFLDSAGLGKTVLTFNKNDIVCNQGDAAKNVIYIQQGSIKLTVVNGAGKEAVVAILRRGDFFGEGCLTTQSSSFATAIAIESTKLLIIEKGEMNRVLRTEHEFADHFIAYVLGRNMRIEQDLIDQLFNSSEKRLARTLLMLAEYGKKDRPNKLVARLSQETLADMIGTTRSRVNFFMNKFKRLGFIKYSHRDIYIDKSLLSVVLDE
jgi:CRP/FNR family cyclic AMP-dependent transcriptional regulator